jgi:hypothetical protein
VPAHMVYRLKWQNEAEMAPAGGGDIMKDDEYHQSHSLKPDQVYFLTVANGVRDVTVTMGDGTVISLTLGPGNGIEIRAGHDSKGMVVRLDARKTGIVGGLKPPAPRGDLGLRTGQEPKKGPGRAGAREGIFRANRQPSGMDGVVGGINAESSLVVSSLSTKGAR